MHKPLKAVSTITILVGTSIAGQAIADEPKLNPPLKSPLDAETTVQVTGTLQVVMDFAKILTLDGAAKTIVIGNSGILDATLNDDRTVVLTGKAAGTTNMIVLGENNHEILNTSVNIVPSQATTVYHGLQRQTYHCVSACTPILSVGDEAQHFDRARAQIQARQDFAVGSSAGQ